MKRTISGLIVFILGSIILLHLVLLIGGFKSYYVKTGSMEPELSIDDIIMVKEKNHYEILSYTNNYREDTDII